MRKRTRKNEEEWTSEKKGTWKTIEKDQTRKANEEERTRNLEMGRTNNNEQ